MDSKTLNYIERAKQAHGDKYDYSQTVFTKSGDKVKIICPKHGVFEQRASNHLLGIGCKQCGREATATKGSYTTEEWIQKATEKHKGRYDYSKVVYTRSSENVTIICKEHGEFQQIARNHLHGDNCPKCSLNEQTKRQLLTYEEFIERINAAYQTMMDRRSYSYELLTKEWFEQNYRGNMTLLPIICEHHGKFEMAYSTHVNNKQGCPTCGRIYSGIKRSKIIEL